MAVRFSRLEELSALMSETLRMVTETLQIGASSEKKTGGLY
jgi:hypothetical protein